MSNGNTDKSKIKLFFQSVGQLHESQLTVTEKCWPKIALIYALSEVLLLLQNI